MQYRVGIDQLKIGMVFSDEDRHEADGKYEAYAGVMCYAGCVRSNVFEEVPGQKVVFKRGKSRAAWTSARQPLTLGGDLEVWYGRHTGAYRARVRMNPSKSDVGELSVHFMQMLPAGFDTLYRYGNVRYAEFFIDVDDVAFADYLYLDPKLRASNDGYTASGTAYLGSELGHRSFAIYDKANELQAKGGITLPVSRLRLEARVRGSYGFAVEQLSEVPNPFTGLAVISRSALQACTTRAARQLWAWVQKGACAQHAYDLLDTANRKELLTLLPELAPNWWKPEVMWTSYAPGLGWIETLRNAGRYGQWLPLGEPVPYSAAMIPPVGKALIESSSEEAPPAPSAHFVSSAIDFTPGASPLLASEKAHD